MHKDNLFHDRCYLAQKVILRSGISAARVAMLAGLKPPTLSRLLREHYGSESALTRVETALDGVLGENLGWAFEYLMDRSKTGSGPSAAFVVSALTTIKEKPNGI